MLAARIPDEIKSVKKELQSIRPSKDSAVYDMAVYLANKPYNIADVIIEKLTKPNDIVFEPFLGSGVTVIEAVRNGRRAIGVDVNPYAINISKASLSHYNMTIYNKHIENIEQSVKDKINALYRTQCDRCERNDGIIVKAEFSNDKLDFVRYYCTFCDSSLKNGGRKIVTRNPAKRHDHQSLKLVDKLEYRISTQARQIANVRFVANGRLCIKEGERMSDFFSKRNLVATCLIYDAINNLPDTKEKELVKFTFLSGIHLMKYTDYKANSQATYYRPKIRLVERNVWEVFEDRVELIKRGREEYEEELADKAVEAKNIDEIVSGKGTFFVTLGDTRNLSNIFPNENGAKGSGYVDFVLTDPPYADQVQYLDYGQLWNMWGGKKSIGIRKLS